MNDHERDPEPLEEKQCGNCLAYTDAPEGHPLECVCETPLDCSHGSPYDRGRADSYYGRPVSPHRWVFDEHGEEKRLQLVTDQEVLEYNRGYCENSDLKQWT